MYQSTEPYERAAQRSKYDLQSWPLTNLANSKLPTTRHIYLRPIAERLMVFSKLYPEDIEFDHEHSNSELLQRALTQLTT